MSIELVTITAEFKTAGGAVLMNTPISFILREDIASEDDVYHAQVFRGWINASGLLKAADGSSAFQLPTYSNGTSAARFSVIMPRGVNLKDYMTVPTGKLNFNVTYNASPVQLAGLLNTGAGAATDTVLVAIDDAMDDAAVRFDKAQSLTSPQKVQALSNIGLPSLSDTGVVTTFAATSENIFNSPIRNSDAPTDSDKFFQIVKNNWSPAGHPSLIYLEGSIGSNTKGWCIDIFNWTKLASNQIVNSFGGILGAVYHQSNFGTSTYGISIGVIYSGVNPTGHAIGGDFRATISGGGQVEDALGCNSIVQNYQSSTVASMSVFKGQAFVDGAATVTPILKGLDLSGWASTGSAIVDNVYGIYIDSSIDFGETTYAIYSLSTAPSLLTGSLTANSFSTVGSVTAQSHLIGDAVTNTDRIFQIVKNSWAHPNAAVDMINLTTTIANNTSVKGVNISLTRQNAGSAGSNIMAIQSIVTNNFVGTASNFNPHQFTLINSGAGVIATTCRGLYFAYANLSGGAITTGHAIYAEIQNSGASSTITTAGVYKVRARNLSSAVITTLRGMDFSEWSNSGTVTTSYVIYIAADTSVGTTPFCIYSLSTAPSEFAGTIQATAFKVGGNQVVGARGAAITDATDAASAITQLNLLLAAARTHGLIAT